VPVEPPAIIYAPQQQGRRDFRPRNPQNIPH
jgi:hypothetical protein